MPLEIERKFLVDGDYKSLATSHSHIVQGYLCSQHNCSVRVRVRDKKGYLTIKSPSFDGGLSRYEFEKEITLDEALSLLHLCEGSVIDKIRWLVPIDSHIYEVDEFLGDNAGLTIAEIELKSANEPYERAPFLGKEVTGNRQYYNSSLRTNPFKNWK